MGLLLNLNDVVNSAAVDSASCRNCSSELDKSVLVYTSIHVAVFISKPLCLNKSVLFNNCQVPQQFPVSHYVFPSPSYMMLSCTHQKALIHSLRLGTHY